MKINFEKNNYFSAFLKDQSLDLDCKSIKCESSIKVYAKYRPQFKYGDITFKKFSAERIPEVKLAFKIFTIPLVIPAMLWYGVIKTIVDISKAILIGIPKAVLGNGNYLKAQVFHVVRDLQMSFGCGATLFNAKFGLYHFQEANFHKTCYDCFKESKKKFDIFDLDNLQNAIQTGLLKRSDLRKLSEEQLRNLKLSKLPKSAIGHIFSHSEDLLNEKEKFKVFSPEDVKLALEKNLLSKKILRLLSDEQLKGVKLSTLSKETIDDLFHDWNGLEDNAQRFRNFTTEDVQEAILLGLINDSKLLSDEHLENLEVSKFSKTIINDLFTSSKCFAKLSASEVKKAYFKGILDDKLFLISDQQKREIGPKFKQNEYTESDSSDCVSLVSAKVSESIFDFLVSNNPPPTFMDALCLKLAKPLFRIYLEQHFEKSSLKNA